MVNNLLMHFAPDGNLYVAVFDVVMNVTYIGCFIYTAACETMSPLASTFNAEHNRENLIELLKTALCMAVSAVSCWALSLLFLQIPLLPCSV